MHLEARLGPQTLQRSLNSPNEDADQEDLSPLSRQRRSRFRVLCRISVIMSCESGKDTHPRHLAHPQSQAHPSHPSPSSSGTPIIANLPALSTLVLPCRTVSFRLRFPARPGPLLPEIHQSSANGMPVLLGV